MQDDNTFECKYRFRAIYRTARLIRVEMLLERS